MKKLVALLLLLPALTACKKDKPAATPLAPPADLVFDGHTYKTVRIGGQVWMAENLRSTHYQNGEDITLKTADIEWAKETEGYCNPLINDMDVSTEYGKLYNWYTLTDPRNIAPAGWRVPTQADFNKLISFLGGGANASNAFREKGTTHWPAPNTGATNSTGFTAFLSPWRYPDGAFSIDQNAYWLLSSTTAYDGSVRIFNVIVNGAESKSTLLKTSGTSIRLIKE